jgi:hypothetical protein
MPGEPNMLGMTKMLVPKKHDLPFEKCLADIADYFRCERLGKINAFDLGTNVYRHWSNINLRTGCWHRMHLGPIVIC